MKRSLILICLFAINVCCLDILSLPVDLNSSLASTSVDNWQPAASNTVVGFYCHDSQYLFVYQIGKYTMYNISAENVVDQVNDQFVYFESIGSTQIVAAFSSMWLTYDYNGTDFSNTRVDIDSNYELVKFSHNANVYVSVLQNKTSGSVKWIVGTNLGTTPDPDGNFVLSGLDFIPLNLSVHDINSDTFNIYYAYNDQSDSGNLKFMIKQVQILSSSTSLSDLHSMNLNQTIGCVSSIAISDKIYALGCDSYQNSMGVVSVYSKENNQLITSQVGFSETYKLGTLIKILHFDDASQNVIFKSTHVSYGGSLGFIEIYWNRRNTSHSETKYIYSRRYNAQNFTEYGK